MSEPFYVSHSTIHRGGVLQRRAEIALGASFELGVHGAIARHYRLDPPRELPLPVDYIVAATGG